MFRLETRGGPRQRGRQQGEATRTLAQRWLQPALAQLARQRAGGSIEGLVAGARPLVGRWVGQWRAVFPDGVEECLGIAAGLAWSEDLYLTALCHHRLSGRLPQCTLVGRREAGRPRFAKTDDIGRQQLGMNVLEVCRPEAGHACVHIHFAATPWTVAGMNRPGLAMGMTGIPGPMKDEDGLFSLMALHTVLPACADVPEAVAHLRDLPVNAYGFSLMLADAAGRLALVEKTGAGMAVRETAGDEPLVHTNHILDAAFAARNPAQVPAIDANGRRRYDNARALAASDLTLEEIVADRSPAGAVCQRGEDGLHTDFAAIFEPDAGRIHLWSGPPAAMEAQTVDVRRLLA